MITESAAIIISIWGAMLSTILAGLKIWEIYCDRMRLDVSYAFDSRPEEGNKIIVYNLSKTSIMINYWEVLFIRRHYGIFSKTYNKISPDAHCDINIPSHSNYELIFRDQNYFCWSRKYNKSGLYLLLHIAGKRRSIKKFIYDF